MFHCSLLLYSATVLKLAAFDRRHLETLHEEIAHLETKDIRKQTECMKPCKYKKFTFIGEAQTTSFKSEHFSLSLWAVSKDTWLETEVGSQNIYAFILMRKLSGVNLSSLLPPC